MATFFRGHFSTCLTQAHLFLTRMTCLLHSWTGPNHTLSVPSPYRPPLLRSQPRRSLTHDGGHWGTGRPVYKSLAATLWVRLDDRRPTVALS